MKTLKEAASWLPFIAILVLFVLAIRDEDHWSVKLLMLFLIGQVTECRLELSRFRKTGSKPEGK